jgi:hypothetical protein
MVTVNDLTFLCPALVADEAVLNKVAKIIPKNPTLEFLLKKFLPVLHKHLTYCSELN